MTAAWYCIQIQPQLRETADFNLKRQNFQPFWPRIVVVRAGRKPYAEPMFKGYGFVKFDVDADRWLSVNGTIGVIALLPRHTLRPESMRPGFVDALIEHDPMNESDFLKVFEDFTTGSPIEINTYHHFLAGHKGTVLAVRTKMLQIALSGELFDKGVWIDRSYVNPVESET